jgi:hypothetical protein
MKQYDLLVRKFYVLAEQAHMAHEDSRMLVQHEALGEFYEGIIEIKDRLIEYMLGMGYIKVAKSDILEMGSDIVSDALSLSDFFDKVAVECKDTCINNIAGEFRESVGKLKYFYLFKY